MKYALTTLRDGTPVPFIGFGTGVVRRYTRNLPLFLRFRIRPILSSIKHLRLNGILKQDLFTKSYVKQAYREGLRFFDSGRIYAYSEKIIGECMRELVVKRSDVFILTKVSDMDVMREATPHSVAGNLDISLGYLGTDYADAYLVHWPSGDWKGIYKDMEREYERGRVRAIGVCNVTVDHLRDLAAVATVEPMIVQLELHPLNSKRALRDYAREHGILVMAHTPTGRMCEKICASKTLQELAARHGKSIAQIIIRWHYQNGVVPVVATTSAEHMRENQDIFNFELSEQEIAAIEALDEGYVLLPGCGITDPNYIYNL